MDQCDPKDEKLNCKNQPEGNRRFKFDFQTIFHIAFSSLRLLMFSALRAGQELNLPLVISRLCLLKGLKSSEVLFHQLRYSCHVGLLP